MIFDLVECHILASCLRVFYQQELYQLSCLFISHILRELQLWFFDESIKRIGITHYTLSERQPSTNKLIEQNSKRPIVRLKWVAFSLEDFGSHVMRSANDGEGFEHVTGIKLFGSSKVDQIGLAVVVDHWVLWLDVSVDNVVSMQVFDG